MHGNCQSASTTFQQHDVRMTNPRSAVSILKTPATPEGVRPSGRFQFTYNKDYNNKMHRDVLIAPCVAPLEKCCTTICVAPLEKSIYSTH